MTTQIEYALMAGRAYLTSRVEKVNQFPTPAGWGEFRHVPDAQTPDFPVTAGFEAIAFKSLSDPKEIVISYTGTNGPGDIPADLALGGGKWSEQLLQAAQYYLDIKAANPQANITFTGHSLGGGLAALISVFFAVPSTTFDQAQWFVQAGSTDAGTNVLRGGACNVGRVTRQNAITSIAARARSMRSTGRFGMYLHPTGRAACVHRKPACKPINHGVHHA